MADFEEDYLEPFYQKATEKETGNFPVFSKLKKYGFLYVPFMIQIFLLIFIWCTQSELYVPLFFGDLLVNHCFLITVAFFIVMFLFTIIDMKKREKVCFKLALPNLIIQTELFLMIVTLVATFYSSYPDSGNLILIIFVANAVYPVIPVFILILFVIGWVIDKRIGKK